MKSAVQFLLVLAILLPVLAPSAPAADDPGWPRLYESEDGSKLVVHQPQVQSWKDYKKLDARAAIEIQVGKAPKPTLGAIRFTIDTYTDHKSRTVTLDNLQSPSVPSSRRSPGVSPST